ncbi:NUDIX domain-containing protein [Rhodopila sp.]|uniref:NUDIX domain-containing protein n=1 Tax=Rhodopila sp. TaxID=2480087 RepID=UPI003D13BF97
MTPDIKTIESRTVYENRWMRVREDTVARRDGSEGIYGVIEKPDFVTIAAVDAGRIHLVQQYRYPVHGRYWELPQGSWEQAPGTNPLDVARAELREETGIEADEMKYGGHLFLAYGYSTQGYHIFLAKGLRQGHADREHEEQDLITRPFDIAAIEAMTCDGSIKDATTIAALGLLKLKGMI